MLGRIIQILTRVDSIINDTLLPRLFPNHLLNAYIFRELITPFPLSALAKCSPSYIMVNYSGVLRRTCLYNDRVYISIINEIFNESSKFRM